MTDVKTCYRANQTFQELVNLTDINNREHPFLGEVGHNLLDINADLTYRGVRFWEAETYLDRRIEQLQNKIMMFQDEEAIKYLNEVIGLMENIRDKGISLPSRGRPIW